MCGSGWGNFEEKPRTGRYTDLIKGAIKRIVNRNTNEDIQLKRFPTYFRVKIVSMSVKQQSGNHDRRNKGWKLLTLYFPRVTQIKI